MNLKTYNYVMMGNHPACAVETGEIQAQSPMKALRSIVHSYKNPSGLFWAHIRSSKNTNRILAEYLSARANTQAHAEKDGWLEWKGRDLYVNGKKAKKHRETYREVLAYII